MYVVEKVHLCEGLLLQRSFFEMSINSTMNRILAKVEVEYLAYVSSICREDKQFNFQTGRF